LLSGRRASSVASLIQMNGSSRSQNDGLSLVGACVVLVSVVWLAFGQTVGSQFINCDDGMYVYENSIVAQGLTWRGIPWAFTFARIGHWHPVTWFSHMLDCQLFGLWAGGHHAMSVSLHAAVAILLFLALNQMTGSFFRSAIVAALFAVHPQRVESVAWIAERKDVLSGLFFMLTLIAYARYVREPRSISRYLLVVLLFGLGLMSKGMLVTLPFVLLLLDYWPLQRWPRTEARAATAPVGQPSRSVSYSMPEWSIVYSLVREKIPLFVLSGLSILATSLTQEEIPPALQQSIFSRVENAIVSYVIYLKQMFYPIGLTFPALNPPHGFSLSAVGAALAVLITISIGVFVSRKARPYLMVGWLWYLGMLVPVIGIAQISYYARADRYTYLPEIGLWILLVWSLADVFARSRWARARQVLVVAGIVTFGGLILQTRVQASHWRDSETLWRYVLGIDPNNYVARTNLGVTLDEKGKPEAAIAQYEKAAQTGASYPHIHNNFGTVLFRAGRLTEAIAQYRMALHLQPDLPQFRLNLGLALAQNRQFPEAITEFRKAIELNPQFVAAYVSLGDALVEVGQREQALSQFQKALEIKPDYADADRHAADLFLQSREWSAAIAHYQKALGKRPNDAGARFKLAIAWERTGHWRDALAQYRQALQLRPADDGVRLKLAWILATAPDPQVRNGAEAVLMASYVLTNNPGGEQLDALAAAHAEIRDFEVATETAERALQKAQAAGDIILAQQVEQRLELYRRRQPYRQSP
jgi:protein O-mannosyl-transferase